MYGLHLKVTEVYSNVKVPLSKTVILHCEVTVEKWC